MKKRFALFCLALLTAMAAYAQEPVKICAHRGFWKCEEAGNAQNSLAALSEAQNQGFWGSEFDVHITKDDVVVVNHDPTFHAQPIQSRKYQNLSKKGRLANGEVLPTLDSYLDQGLGSPTMLVLELKTQKNRKRADKMMDDCIALLKGKGLWDPSRVMFISFDYEACKRLAALAPEFTIQYLEADKDPDTVHADGINGIDYHYSAFRKHPEWVERAHQLGMSVNAWTVNKADDMQYLIDLGVDCITTNEPLLLRSLLGEREEKAK